MLWNANEKKLSNDTLSTVIENWPCLMGCSEAKSAVFECFGGIVSNKLRAVDNFFAANFQNCTAAGDVSPLTAHRSAKPAARNAKPIGFAKKPSSLQVADDSVD